MPERAPQLSQNPIEAAIAAAHAAVALDLNDPDYPFPRSFKRLGDSACYDFFCEEAQTSIGVYVEDDIEQGVIISGFQTDTASTVEIILRPTSDSADPEISSMVNDRIDGQETPWNPRQKGQALFEAIVPRRHLGQVATIYLRAATFEFDALRQNMAGPLGMLTQQFAAMQEA